MLRRINKQSCRNSLHPIPETEAQGPTVQLPLSRFGSAHLRPSHKKYFSMLCSMEESPLCVRKEALRDKQKEKAAPVAKEPRVKRKQKTEHFNFKYLEWMRVRRQGMSWIEYNMTLGIAYLWKKVQAQITCFQQSKKIKYNQKFEQQVNSISQEIDSIIQDVNEKTPDTQKEGFSKLFRPRDSVEFKSLSTNLAQVSKKINSSSFQTYYKSQQALKRLKAKDKGLVSTAAATPGKEVSLSHLKESVCKLNSFFCLFKRRISLRKEDKLINEFIERRSSNVSFSPQQLQELEQIMKINQERCQLMSEIINNVGILRSHQSSLSQKIIKKIGQIDLIKELGITAEQHREEMLKAKMRSCNNLIMGIIQPTPTQKFFVESTQMVQNSNIFNSINQNCNFPKACKRKVFQRSSIESYVSPHKENYHNTPSKINVMLKEKANHKSSKFVKEEKSKKVEKDSFYIKKVSLKKSTKNEEGEKEKQRKPQRKIIAFAAVQEDSKALTENKSLRTKFKSAKSIKSKREITWDDLEKKEYRSLKSVKSLKSLKSLKSNGSYSELGSRKFLRSLKTQRQMKYLHGHIRNISYISKYRTKLFKLNGLEDENPNQMREFLDATTDNREESSEPSNISIQEDDLKSHESIQLPADSPLLKENIDDPKNSITVVSSASEKSIKIDEKSSQQNEQLLQWPAEKEGIMRDFINRFGLIEKESNMAKQKFLILNELQKMLDGKIITTAMFERYHAYFEGERRSNGDFRYSEKVEAESDKKLRPSHYSNLLNFRKLIQDTTELNQINKYYYNISQFKCEQEQIKKTKQANKREDCFFHIRSSTQQQKRNKANDHYREERVKQWKPKILCQKGI